MRAVLSPPAPTVKIDVIVRVSPKARAPRLQGNGVVQPPVFEANTRPAGVGSLTSTSCAFEGPRFATVST